MVSQQALSLPWKRAMHSPRHSKTFSRCTYSGTGLKHLHISGNGLKLPPVISEMDKRGKRILSTAIQDHTLKNHWVRKINKTDSLPFQVSTAHKLGCIWKYTRGQSLRRSEIQPSATDFCNCWSKQGPALGLCLHGEFVIRKHRRQPNVKKVSELEQYAMLIRTIQLL